MLRRRLILGATNFWNRVINLFRNRVVADLGTFEADACLQRSLPILGQNLYDKASLVITPNAYKAGNIYALKPTNGSGDLTFSRGSARTRRNASGVIELLANNVPALEYPASGCPAWSLEPQRTNTALWSQDFTGAGWSGNNASAVSNTHTAPDGTLTADTISITVNGGFFRRLGISIANNTTYTLSCYLRNIGLTAGQTFRMYLNNNLGSPNSATIYVTIDLVALTAVPVISGVVSAASASITQISTEWSRVTLTFTAGATAAASNCDIGFEAASTPRSFVAWGIQLEVGAFATSYIPTTNATATRVIDAASLTGASALIGQTEGTIYAEVIVSRTNSSLRWILALTDGTTNNTIALLINNPGGTSNRFSCFMNAGNVTQALIDASVTPSIGVHKLAMSYSANDIVLYVDGVQIGVDTSATIPATSVISLGTRLGLDSFDDSIRTAVIFNTRLTNTELQALTTL